MLESQSPFEHRALYPDKPLPGLDNAIDLMQASHDHLDEIGLPQFKSFAEVYLGVTTDVREGQATFVDQASLNTAAGIFSYHYFKQLTAHLDGRSEDVEPHWRVFFDPRMKRIDVGTQLWVGMNNHIIGDLARSVLEAEASPEYVAKDFRRVNGILKSRAHKEAHKFIPRLGHERVRMAVTELAMSTIVGGREYALRDYRRMKNAEGDDEKVAEIIEVSHQRAAKIGRGLLATAFETHKAKGTLLPAT